MKDVVYVPQILCGMKKIMQVFRVGQDRLLDWIDEGAPIATISKAGKTYYSCEVMRLQLWLEKHCQEVAVVSRRQQTFTDRDRGKKEKTGV